MLLGYGRSIDLMIQVARISVRGIDTGEPFEREGDVGGDVVGDYIVVAEKRWLGFVDPDGKWAVTVIDYGDVGFVDAEVARGALVIADIIIVVRSCILFCSKSVS